MDGTVESEDVVPFAGGAAAITICLLWSCDEASVVVLVGSVDD